MLRSLQNFRLHEPQAYDRAVEKTKEPLERLLQIYKVTPETPHALLGLIEQVSKISTLEGPDFSDVLLIYNQIAQCFPDDVLIADKLLYVIREISTAASIERN